MGAVCHLRETGTFQNVFYLRKVISRVWQGMENSPDTEVALLSTKRGMSWLVHAAAGGCQYFGTGFCPE